MAEIKKEELSQEVQQPQEPYVIWLVLQPLRNVDLPAKDKRKKPTKIDFQEYGLLGVCPVFPTEEAAKQYVGDKKLPIVPVQMGGQSQKQTRGFASGQRVVQ